jgi:type III pantothenate kinase
MSIDKRVRVGNAWYIVLENGERVILPPQVDRVPALLLLADGHKFVVSFGTATTFDYIGPDGSYRGGSIAPGVNLSLDALYGAAAMLPRIAIEPPPNESVIGTTTVGQMQIGIYWGYVAMIEGMIARMKNEIGEPVSVIATGGLAILFQQHGHLFDRVEPDLTLRGLALLYRNREKT